MAYPTKLAGQRNYETLLYALVQMADTALLLDTRAKAIQHAYAGVLATEFEAATTAVPPGGGFPAGTGATYKTLMDNLAAFLATPAWTQMMQFVDAYRDITR